MFGEVVAQYEIVAKIAEGGMGAVYKARGTQLNRLVALKFISPAFTNHTKARNQLIAEARAAFSLDHPNICTIFGISETPDGRLFMAMAYYEGQTLRQLISAGQKGSARSLNISEQTIRYKIAKLGIKNIKF